MRGPYCSICPSNLFADDEMVGPDEYEENMARIVEMIDEAEEKNINMVTSVEMMLKIMELFPWNKMEEETWKNKIIDWEDIMFDFLKKAHRVKIEEEGIEDCTCSYCKEEVLKIWGKVLAKYRIHDDRIGVFVNNRCELQNIEQLIEDRRKREAATSNVFFYKEKKSVEYVTHFWKIFYPQTLPTQGFSFCPPDNWHYGEDPIRGPQNGFIDKNGNEWCLDKYAHKGWPHWDVQLREPIRDCGRNVEYIRIDFYGNKR